MRPTNRGLKWFTADRGEDLATKLEIKRTHIYEDRAWPTEDTVEDVVEDRADDLPVVDDEGVCNLVSNRYHGQMDRSGAVSIDPF